MQELEVLLDWITHDFSRVGQHKNKSGIKKGKDPWSVRMNVTHTHLIMWKFLSSERTRWGPVWLALPHDLVWGHATVFFFDDHSATTNNTDCWRRCARLSSDSDSGKPSWHGFRDMLAESMSALR